MAGDEMMQRRILERDMRRRKVRYRPSYQKREGTTRSFADRGQCVGEEAEEGATKTTLENTCLGKTLSLRSQLRRKSSPLYFKCCFVYCIRSSRISATF